MARTTPLLVKKILGRDYNVDAGLDLQPYIDSANILVNQCAARQGSGMVPISLMAAGPLTPAELEITERWLAAHLYSCSDKQHQQVSDVKGNSASYSTKNAMGFELTTYGQQAIRLDRSGYLRALDRGAVAGMHWLGKLPIDQIPYDQRNGSMGSTG